MKRFALLSMFVIAAVLLSSCSIHLGLSKLLGGSNKVGPTATKHIKATHTPPSPTQTSGVSAPTAAINTITITSAGFEPNALQVKIGTTVTWTNNDIAAHTVTADTIGLFDSGPIKTGGTFTFTFSRAGTFNYHSTSDANMTGTITVTP